METCQYLYYKGKLKGKRCETRTKGKYCYRHKDCAAANPENNKSNQLKNDPVFNSGSDGKEPEKLYSSVFLLTINRNRTLENMSQDEKIQFRKFVDFILERENLVKDFINDATCDDPNETIESIQIERYFEQGPLNHLVHAHAYINIQHRGHISLNVADIRALSRKIFPENIYINVMVTSDPSVGYRNYIRKSAGKIEI